MNITHECGYHLKIQLNRPIHDFHELIEKSSKFENVTDFSLLIIIKNRFSKNEFDHDIPIFNHQNLKKLLFPHVQ